MSLESFKDLRSIKSSSRNTLLSNTSCA